MLAVSNRETASGMFRNTYRSMNTGIGCYSFQNRYQNKLFNRCVIKLNLTGLVKYPISSKNLIRF
jgi:hypothetical protein